MSASIASPDTLLRRILSLKESTPFLVTLDTVNQTHQPFTNEFIYLLRSTSTALSITFISFETSKKFKPKYLTDQDTFLPFYALSDSERSKEIEKLSQTKENGNAKNLIVIDTFNSLKQDQLIVLLKSLITVNNFVYGIYHLDIPVEDSTANSNKPTPLTYIKFLSSVIFDIRPSQNFDELEYYSHLDAPTFPKQLSSNANFLLELTYRRKSGRELQYQFNINTLNHEYKLITREVEQTAEDESLLKDLTTFNLTTNDKQKKQKEQVDLPFMEAQKSLGSVGTAIVYTFEKDDDYDEEDPYEDPF